MASGRPRVDHEVFRDDLEPVHHRLARKDVLVMRNAETDSDAVVLKRIEAIAGHEECSQFQVHSCRSVNRVSVEGSIPSAKPPK